MSNAEKPPTGHGPEGSDENGPAAALLVGYVSVQICALLTPCRRPILIATKAMLFMGQDTRRVLSSLNSKAIPPFERCLDAGLRGEALFLCNRREVNQLPKLDGTNVIYLYTR
jgi:hypothetical protein